MKKWIIITVLAMTATIVSAQKENWYQIGFKIGTQFPIVHNYTDVDYLTGTRTVHFGGYFRAGKYVYGEIGFGYQYFKNRFRVTLPNDSVTDDLVENRYLVIPVKVVGDVRITKKISFMPQVGISYQPLLKVTENNLGYSKENIKKHWVLLTAGFDMRLGYITIGVDYRYSFQHFFQNKEGQKPQYIGISAGVIF
ncbi:MAG: hypothetical protein IKO75_12580 [Bacteroidales bacterium]|nr:hypothetical protein [Bacteroidales bacterium]